jgi:hypothetical protein
MYICAVSLCQQRGQKKTHGERTWWYTQRNGASLFRFHPQPLALAAAAGIHQTFCPIRFLLLLFNSSGWWWCWWWLILLGGEDRKEAETKYVQHGKFVIFL